MNRAAQQPLRVPSARKRDMRTQFGAICWRMKKGKLQVLLVTTRTTRRWTPPKGWPIDGLTPAGSAAREAYEEAGVSGSISETCLGIYSYTKELAGDDLPCVVALFPLKVERKMSMWPEKPERRRRWMSPKKAASRVREPELARLLRNFDPGVARLKR
ncbi:NUDIX hydrolase [Tranquillimonas rosea]